MTETRKPKILYVNLNHPEIRPGGAEGFALELYKSIVATGDFEGVFLARHGPPFNPVRRYHSSPITTVNDDPNQYLIHADASQWDHVYQRAGDKTLLTRFYRDFLLAHKPDIVHFHHTLFLGYDMIRVTRNTLPEASIVHMLHEYLPICQRDGQLVRATSGELCEEETPRRCNQCFPDIPPEAFFMRKRFIQSQMSLVDLFMAPSEYVKQRYVDWGIPASKIQVEPYAIRDPEAGRLADGSAERPRNRFAFFGQFTPYKGADVLLEAIAMLRRDFPGHLWVHGANLKHQPEDFQQKFKQLLDAAGDSVTMAGSYDHANDLPKLMARTDWVIVPSIWWETGPLVVLEAFQHGRPVICSDIGGMSEKVDDGVSGLHFRRADPSSLARVMRRAVEEPGLWDRLHDGIPPVYDIDDHAATMAERYRALLATGPARTPRNPAGDLVADHA